MVPQIIIVTAAASMPRAWALFIPAIFSSGGMVRQISVPSIEFIAKEPEKNADSGKFFPVNSSNQVP
jgi:hypothetical protein